MQYLSSDLTKAVVSTNVPLTSAAGAALAGSWGLYLWNSAAPAYQLLSSPGASLPPDTSGGPWSRFTFEAASDGMEHIVFSSRGRQLTEDGLPADETAGAPSSVYKWSDGQLEFMSVLPNGAPASSAQAGARSVFPRGQNYPGDHLVSNDGTRVFFTDLGALYVRVDGEATETISAPERTGEEPTPTAGTFWAAEADHGSRALFTSGAPLTDDATTVSGLDDLYLWNGDAIPGERLTNLTAGTPSGAATLGVAGTSDDLTHAYFVAGAALTGDAVEGEPNLYEWRAGAGLRLVGTLSFADAGVWSVQRNAFGGARYRDARITADGDRLLFASSARLTSYDNAGSRQVYLYDADSGDLTCVSCPPPGTAPAGDAGLFPVNPNAEISTPYRLPRNLSDDGSTVVFETEDALSPRDSNGKPDVYLWRQGELSLITSGQGVAGSRLVDASTDASDIFFITRERLVGSDADNQNDMYDVRVGGGFPEATPPVSCQGDACQGEVPSSPSFSAPPTSTLLGDGNVKRSVRAPSKPKKCAGRRPGRAKAGCPKAKTCKRGSARKRGKHRCAKKRQRAANNGGRR